MKSLADGLPTEIARQIHPDWRKNEAAYWAVRDQLLGRYEGQWIGFADGVVVASGSRPVVVFHAAHQAAEHPYVICVGRENEPYRMRRANFAYDTSYPGEALPVNSKWSWLPSARNRTRFYESAVRRSSYEGCRG